MGLTERRKIKELQDVTLPARVNEIQQLCGKAIPFEVDWESFADDAEALNFLDNLAGHRLCMALRMICTDDFAREAVREGLKAVRVKNVKSKDQMRMTCDGGVLEMHGAYALRTDGIFHEGEIKDLLMKKL
jgi:hypothetical protein